MTRSTWTAAGARWQRYAHLGILIVMVFLAHDFGMASASTHGDLQIHPRMSTLSSVSVLHVADDSAASHDLASHARHDIPDAPVQSECETLRAAVTTANDTFDAPRQASPGSNVSVVGWHDAIRPLWLIDVSFRSSRERRELFQVFLI
jgi:hypothetical protein